MKTPTAMRDAAHGWVLLPRMRRVAPDTFQTTLDNALAGWQTNVTAVARLRCGMEDCPGDLGHVAMIAYVAGIADYYWGYHTPRGFVKRDDGCWCMGGRARSRRDKGLNMTGRAAHGRAGDWNKAQPLGAKELPAEGELMDEGVPLYIRCDRCPRLMRVSIADVRAFLLDERSSK